MNIALCEDEAIYVEEILRSIDRWSAANNMPKIKTFVYAAAEDLLEDWSSGRTFDLIFLDILLKSMSGYDLAIRIRKDDPNVPIVFVTNSEEYAIKGYEVGAYRYIKKPIAQAEIDACLNRCRQYMLTMIQAGFPVRHNGYTIRIAYRDVFFIEYQRHQLLIHAAEDQLYTCPLYTSFEEYFSELPSSYFVRCHRAFIVNMNHVDKFTAKTLFLTNQAEIPIGRTYRSNTLAQLLDYFRNGV